MCEGPVPQIIHDFIPHHIKPGRITASESEMWPNLLCDPIPIIHNHNFNTQPNSFDTLIRQCPCTVQNDMSLPRFVKRTRTASTSRASNWTQGTPHFNIAHQDTSRGSLNAEILPGRTNYTRENHSHRNLENKLAGKRKMYDPNENVDDNFECTWPLLTETLDEEDSDETSDSSSDSETYSGPS